MLLAGRQDWHLRLLAQVLAEHRPDLEIAVSDVPEADGEFDICIADEDFLADPALLACRRRPQTLVIGLCRPGTARTSAGNTAAGSLSGRCIPCDLSLPADLRRTTELACRHLDSLSGPSPTAIGRLRACFADVRRFVGRLLRRAQEASPLMPDTEVAIVRDEPHRAG